MPSSFNEILNYFNYTGNINTVNYLEVLFYSQLVVVLFTVYAIIILNKKVKKLQEENTVLKDTLNMFTKNITKELIVVKKNYDSYISTVNIDLKEKLLPFYKDYKDFLLYLSKIYKRKNNIS